MHHRVSTMFAREFVAAKELRMPQGSKSKYTSKQKRKAEHIEESYEKRGAGKKEAQRRAWATVNKSSGGGKKERRGPGQSREQGAVEERRPKRWRGVERPIEGRPFEIREEGRTHPREARVMKRV